MLGTVALLLLSALTALAGIPLILKLVPRNEIYGVRTLHTLSREKTWYKVNRFAGYALVGAAALMVLALTLWANTLLRPFWLQLALFVLLLAVAVGATFAYERHVARDRKQRKLRQPTGRPVSG